jgi:predicted 3-demethylubiquinone-9 3-methyltransferase (glyoxalase superfamily)
MGTLRFAPPTSIYIYAFVLADVMQTITPCLRFNSQAEEAVDFYLSVFKNSRILRIAYFAEGLPLPAGSVMTIQFVLDGQELVALNGGPAFKFTPAISLVANCETQEEVDHLWQKLSEGGSEERCGWLTDKYSVSWQVVPTVLPDMLTKGDSAAAQRAINAMLQMKKLDIATLGQAYENN